MTFRQGATPLEKSIAQTVASRLDPGATINDVLFTGAAPIVVAAAAGTLTGTTLNSTVVNSSLNSVTPTGGTLAVTGHVGVRTGNALRLYSPDNNSFASMSLDALGVVGLNYDFAVNGAVSAAGTIAFGQFTNGTEPAYAPGLSYYNTTIGKLKIGGASAWETVTST